MKLILSLIFLCLQSKDTQSFSPSSSINSFVRSTDHVNRITNKYHFQHESMLSFTNSNVQQHNLRASNDEQNENNGLLTNIKLNPPYAIAYLSFLLLATYMSSIEPSGASQTIIEKFISYPLHPENINELFITEFNLLGLIGIPMSCLVMPGSKGQSLPAPPFLVGSSFAGYGALGIYMSTRQRPETLDNSNDTIGFVTRNILENKIFNWIVVGLALNTFVVTGVVSAFMNDGQSLWDGYLDTITSSALGFVSTVDLTILCLTAASLIPEDLERRGVKDSGKAVAIAASTLLLPVVGTTLYCALRPSLNNTEE